MMRSATLLCLFVVVFGFTGCSGDSALRGEAEMKELIAAQAVATERLYNPGFSEQEIEAAAKKVQAAFKKLADLKLTEDEMKKLMDKYKDKLRPGTKFD